MNYFVRSIDNQQHKVLHKDKRKTIQTYCKITLNVKNRKRCGRISPRINCAVYSHALAVWVAFVPESLKELCKCTTGANTPPKLVPNAICTVQISLLACPLWAQGCGGCSRLWSDVLHCRCITSLHHCGPGTWTGPLSVERALYCTACRDVCPVITPCFIWSEFDELLLPWSLEIVNSLK